jgi:hypothetical protein
MHIKKKVINAYYNNPVHTRIQIFYVHSNTHRYLEYLKLQLTAYSGDVYHRKDEVLHELVLHDNTGYDTILGVSLQ